jgi:hypothetical protein
VLGADLRVSKLSDTSVGQQVLNFQVPDNAQRSTSVRVEVRLSRKQRKDREEDTGTLEPGTHS